MPARANGGDWASNDAFAGGVLGDFAGEVALSAQRVSITPKLAAREFRAALRLSKDAIAFDGMTGEHRRRPASAASWRSSRPMPG